MSTSNTYYSHNELISGIHLAPFLPPDPPVEGQPRFAARHAQEETSQQDNTAYYPAPSHAPFLVQDTTNNFSPASSTGSSGNHGIWLNSRLSSQYAATNTGTYPFRPDPIDPQLLNHPQQPPWTVMAAVLDAGVPAEGNQEAAVQPGGGTAVPMLPSACPYCSRPFEHTR